MTKKKSFLWLELVITFVLVAVAVTLSLTVGLNLGTEIGGGSLVQIKVESGTSVGSKLDDARKVLEQKGYYVERAFVEDKGTESYIVLRTTSKDVKADVKAAIAQKLEVSADSVLDPVPINGTVTKNAVLWTAVALVCLLLGIFVLGWIRYKLIGGLALMFSALHALILAVSLLIITHISISFTTLIVAMCCVALVIFAEVLTLERVREEAKYKHNENMPPRELVAMSTHASLKPLIVFAGMVLILALVFVCVPMAHIAMTGASILVCLVAAAFSYYFVGMETYASLFELKAARDKMKLSRNPDVKVDARADKNAQAKASKDAAKKNKDKAKKDKEFKKQMQAKTKSKDESKPVV